MKHANKLHNECLAKCINYDHSLFFNKLILNTKVFSNFHKLIKMHAISMKKISDKFDIF